MIEHLNGKTEIQDGELESKAKVAHFDADLYEPIRQMLVTLHPLTQQPVVNAITVGGMSKRLGIAKDLLPSYFSGNGNPGDKSLQWAVQLAFEAADALIAEDKKSRGRVSPEKDEPRY